MTTLRELRRFVRDRLVMDSEWEDLHEDHRVYVSRDQAVIWSCAMGTSGRRDRIVGHVMLAPTLHL